MHYCRHENVMPLLDSFTSHSCSILIMEFIETTVFGFLEQNGPFPEDLLLKLFCGAVQGLHHLHDKGIALGDIHGGNIFIRGMGQANVSISEVACPSFYKCVGIHFFWIGPMLEPGFLVVV